MTDNLTPANENSEPQIPNQVNWNQMSWGLKSFYIVEQILAGFRKVMSFGWGWDAIATIWRPIAVDSNGNIRTSSGTQSANAPLTTLYTVTTTPQVALPFNPARSSFTLINNAVDDTYYSLPILISYPNKDENFEIILPPGYAYFDDNWQGTVSVYHNAGGITALLTIVER